MERLRSYVQNLTWLKSGLFWRTFLMLAILITCSMLAWFANFRSIENAPNASQISAQLSSITNLTRSALQHAGASSPSQLIDELAKFENLLLVKISSNDKVSPIRIDSIQYEIQEKLKLRLPAETRFASEINGKPGFWLSIRTQKSDYWLRFDEARITPPLKESLINWATITFFLTLLGAALISKLINDPLAKLSEAARLVATGKRPHPLPEAGPKEIMETNISFNRMVDDLVRIDADRAVILAGISHDLRTPLARMQLEVEMAHLEEDAMMGMQTDLQQMDAIIAQFLDYAKPLENMKFEVVNISDLLQQLMDEYSRVATLLLRTAIDPNLKVMGNPTELRRLFTNIIENARRYGKTPGSPVITLDVQCGPKKRDRKPTILISFRDHGPGVPEHDIPRLLKPFTRADAARSQANGSGLGLAIVDRIVKRHHGKLRLYNHHTGGLVTVIAFTEHREN